MNYVPPTALADFYKLGHRPQYPKKTEVVYATWTQRGSRLEGITDGVVFGPQAFCKGWLIDYFNDNFFSRPKEECLAEYSRIVKYCLGVKEPEVQHLSDLHDLGYLPLLIKSIDEGTLVPLRVPMFTIQNTNPRFFWLTNYIETLMSCEVWPAMNSAAIAYHFRKDLDEWAMETTGSRDFCWWQGHDFSMRGMEGVFGAMLSAAGHALSFYGSDTIPVVPFLERFYNAKLENEIIIGSVNASEHSVMCAHGFDERATFRYLFNTYPTGILSVVSDTWDLWKVVEEVLPDLKPEIMARDGKLVIRPDSGDPVKIICGDPDSKREVVRKGVVEALWDRFGGFENGLCYKELDKHIGAIYGDSINRKNGREICERLAAKKFASTNVVLGIGSYQYQYNTRDSLGQALKSTAVIIDGVEHQIFKDPVTDSGLKKSQKGRVVVYRSKEGEIRYMDGQSLKDEFPEDLLKPIFLNGKMVKETSLAEIRKRLHG